MSRLWLGLVRCKKLRGSADQTVCILHFCCRRREEGILDCADDGDIWCIALQHYEHHAFLLQVCYHGRVFAKQLYIHTVKALHLGNEHRRTKVYVDGENVGLFARKTHS